MSTPTQDERLLLKRFAETRDPRIREELVERFMPLARSLALRYRGGAEAVEDLVYGGLEEMGGAFSAEHGVGLDKRKALARLGAGTRIATMRAIKQALDPQGRMNPGKVLEG